MSGDTEMLRTFIALPLPRTWIDALASVIEELSELVPSGVRWVDPNGIHLTLRFLGSTEPGVVPRIVDGLRRDFSHAAPPELTLAGLGTFPPRRNPRVVWAGVSGQMDFLSGLHTLTEALVGSLGWASEGRPFRPHLTLGRMRDRASDAQRRRLLEVISAAEIPRTPPWRPGQVRLYRSLLTPSGPIYSSLGDVELNSPP